STYSSPRDAPGPQPAGSTNSRRLRQPILTSGDPRPSGACGTHSPAFTINGVPSHVRLPPCTASMRSISGKGPASVTAGRPCTGSAANVECLAGSWGSSISHAPGGIALVGHHAEPQTSQRRYPGCFARSPFVIIAPAFDREVLWPNPE